MRATRAMWAACTRYIFADIENCMNRKNERRWLPEICKNVAELRTYAAARGHAEKFAAILVEPGPNAADKRIIADVKATLKQGGSDVLVLTKDRGIKVALSKLKVKPKLLRFASDASGVTNWLSRSKSNEEV